jgi:signal peptidase I
VFAPTVRRAPAAQRTPRRSSGEALVAVGLALLASLAAVIAWVAEPVRIGSDSMRPTLLPGDHVLVDKVSPHGRDWRRGDRVAFHRPETGELVVKRVAGLGGDEVAIEDGVLLVNGHPVAEPYADPGAIDGVYFGPVRVPSGRVFVLGDNRGNSQDSRTFGPVPERDLEGRVVAVLWPPSRWSDVDPH